MRENTVAMMSLDDRILHLPGEVHGVAECGETLRDTWQVGPLIVLSDKAADICEECFDDW